MPDEPAAPSTPAEFRAIAKRHDEVADKLESEVALRRQLAELARVSADALEKGLLTTARDSATVEPQMEAESAGAGRSRGQLAPAHLGHKFVAMLVRRNLTVRDVGDHLEKKLKRKFPNQTIQSWYRDEDDRDYRPTPEDAAEVLKEDFAVPRNAWARVVKPRPRKT